MDWFMIFKAFLVGGLLCVIGQLFIDLTAVTPAKILISYVCIGVFLTAIGAYDHIVAFAGGGATIPIMGFGYSLAKGVEEAVKEKGIIGVISGGLTATAGGVTASIVLGFIFSLVAFSKDKS